jgi:AraC family transcriptional regulator, arabinose operon regulatory protein
MDKFAGTTGDKGTSIYIPDSEIKLLKSNPALENFLITKVGLYVKAAGHYASRTSMEEYVIIYCLEGLGWYRSQNREIKITHGDVLLCDINTKYEYGADTDMPWTILWCHFSGSLSKELVHSVGLSFEENVKKIGLDIESKYAFEKIMKTLADGYSFLNVLHASISLQEFLCIVGKNITNKDFKKKNTYDATNLISYMKENIFKPDCTLGEISLKSNISKYYLSRRFKDATGYPPVEYYIRLKIQKACELLDTTTLSVNEISNLLCYNNQFYFSEIFKRIIGCSPQKYRRLQKGTVAHLD